MQKWRLVSSEMAYCSDYITVLNDILVLPDGSTMEYKRVELKDFCSVLPMVGNRKIVMIDIYRYPANYMSREIPSGFVEQGENPRTAAFRELGEETGYRARKMTEWGQFYPWTHARHPTSL